MDTFDAIVQRRSVKHFDTECKIPYEETHRLLSHAILSPTSFNIQNWRLINVVDPNLRRQIREAAWDQAQVTEASLLFVICADLMAWAKDPDRYWQNAPEAVQNQLVPLITRFYQNQTELQRDEAIRSTGLIGQTIMLAAKAMGYDSCPMVGFDVARVSQLINLPDDHIVSFMIVVGKATEPARERGGQLPLEDIVMTDRF